MLKGDKIKKKKINFENCFFCSKPKGAFIITKGAVRQDIIVFKQVKAVINLRKLAQIVYIAKWC